MVGAHASEVVNPCCNRPPPPTYPPGNFFRARPRLDGPVGESEAKTLSHFQNLSSFKGVEQPIVYMVEGVGLNTLTKRVDEIQAPECRCIAAAAVNVVTLMVCNLPRKVTQERLAQVVDELGFAGMYDLIYIPLAAEFSHGYGFVNFHTPDAAASFSAAIKGYRFCDSSSKRAFAQPAKTQGFHDTLATIRSGGNARKRGHFPLLFKDIQALAGEDLALGHWRVFL